MHVLWEIIHYFKYNPWTFLANYGLPTYFLEGFVFLYAPQFDSALYVIQIIWYLKGVNILLRIWE